MKLRWHRDPAASGERFRAFAPNEDGACELIVYFDGRWEVRGGPVGLTLASGTEKGKHATGAAMPPHDCERAKKRAVLVYEALTKTIPDP